MPPSEPQPVKLRDIAEAAGVTIATASRSLNGSYGVNPSTRKRVLEVASRLQYRPNRLARGLVTGRSQIIGLIISDIRNPFFSEVARGVEDAAYSAGCDVVLCNSDLDAEKQNRYIASLMAKRVDGIIMNSVTALRETEQEQLAQSGVPVVLLNKSFALSEFSTVSADNERGGRLAAEHFLRMGHRRLAHLTGPRQHGNLTLRAKGFTQAVREADPATSVAVLHGGHTLAGGYAMALKLFNEKQDVTAIFAANDAVAFGVLKAAMERGLRIPKDVSLIGFDDVDFASIVHPPLTTIRQSKYDIGEAAVSILMRLAKGKDKSPENRVLGVELIERESVRKLN
ncbi:MAG: LacI family DNA-binding transcriptional regulator [Acidobacteriaceae bacterium]|nr:LacI family DNA-binding transcriptional regulator [Acidobacteriaceae bacterium]MBV9442715.1 LacI family DNA-binding transcriptional regulator [Acidobacteriaceae bacterium]